MHEMRYGVAGAHVFPLKLVKHISNVCVSLMRGYLKENEFTDQLILHRVVPLQNASNTKALNNYKDRAVLPIMS